MDISSIDELLGGSQTSEAPKDETQYQDEPDSSQEIESEYDYDEDRKEEVPEKLSEPESEDEGRHEIDEYGNEKERMPKGMKERFDRKDKQHRREIEQRETEINHLRAQLAQQGASQQVQQAAQDFEYDPQASGDWQQQLAQFVRKEVSAMTRDEQEKQTRVAEEKAHAEFRDKFRAGMERFNDFIEVVEAQPLDDAMTVALRGIADPAAFIYAAAKRNPQELERISKLRDPYARMVEMGKLEERMRKNKPTTSAPRPLGRHTEDSAANTPRKKTEPDGDDLLSGADAKRLATAKQRLKGNR